MKSFSKRPKFYSVQTHLGFETGQCIVLDLTTGIRGTYLTRTSCMAPVLPRGTKKTKVAQQQQGMSFKQRQGIASTETRHFPSHKCSAWLHHILFIPRPFMKAMSAQVRTRENTRQIDSTKDIIRWQECLGGMKSAKHFSNALALQAY